MKSGNTIVPIPKEHVAKVREILSKYRAEADRRMKVNLKNEADYQAGHAKVTKAMNMAGEGETVTIAERVKQGWIAIMKVGRHRAMNGKDYEFSEADLDKTVAAYDPALSEAPCVIGHPEIDAPAYGWAERLERDGELLWAKPRAVAAQFAEWVRQGFYRKISAAFYPPETSPVPGVYYLRHIGFLGAAPPAVKGLPQAAFAGARGSVAFEEPMPLLEELTVKEEMDRLDEIMRLFWDQIWQIRWAAELPNKKEVILAKVTDLASAIGSVNFSEEDRPMEQKTFKQWLREGLEELGLIKPAPAASPVQFTEAQVQEREQAAAAKAEKDAEAKVSRARREAEIKTEVAAFAATILPAQREIGVPQLLEHLMLAETSVAFAEGQPPKPASEIVKSLCSHSAKFVPQGEHAPGGAADPDAALKAEFATGKAVHDQTGVTFEMFKKQRTARSQ
jgi:hypothetical protein